MNPRFDVWMQTLADRDHAFYALAALALAWIPAWIALRGRVRLQFWYLTLGLSGFYGSLIALFLQQH